MRMRTQHADGLNKQLAEREQEKQTEQIRRDNERHLANRQIQQNAEINAAASQLKRD